MKTYSGDPKLLSPVTLAFIGDGVYELIVRERLLGNGGMPAGRLHALAVEKVRASAQAEMYMRLEEVLTQEEKDILKRGRNASTTKVPKNCPPADYRKATAVEALFGYLYLSGRIDRILELYEIASSE